MLVIYSLKLILEKSESTCLSHEKPKKHGFLFLMMNNVAGDGDKDVQSGVPKGKRF